MDNKPNLPRNTASNSIRSKKHKELLALREENNRLKNELKNISKQLSLHINKQLRDKSNLENDDEKDAKLIDRNLANSHKRLEIVEYEYEHLKHRLK